jgi:UDP-N-acetyl-2-amino-2-deoxyglucuronate dehydrogenase
VSRSIGFAIIGCGLVAPFHARAIANITDARHVAFADLLSVRAERLAQEFGGAAVTDYRRLLDRKDVDVICICTPNGAHEEIAINAARAGKHLLIEKPIEVTLEKVDRIIAEAEQAGVKVATIFQCRFRPVIRRIKQAIEQGRFGRLLCGDIYMKWHRSEDYYRSEAWRGQPEQGAGVLMQHASHYLDLLQWLVGPVENVMARTDNLAHPGIPIEDTAMALLKYRNGAVGVMESSTAIYPGIEVRLEIHGEYGSAITEGTALRSWIFKNPSPSDEQLSSSTDGYAGAAAHGATDFSHIEHQLLIEDMIAAIREDREPAVNGREGRKVLEIINAIHASAQAGRVITLPAGNDGNDLHGSAGRITNE